MNVIMFGAPGAGKGTQAEVVSDVLKIPQISTGNILREAVKNGTEYGLKAKESMDAGKLVSDEIVIGILKDRISQPDCSNGYILDGFPRTVPQAEALAQLGVNIDKVIEIAVDDEKIEKRLGGRRVCEGCGASYHIEHKPAKKDGVCDKCGANVVIRKDDSPEVVKDRLATYHQQTAPLKDYYKEQNKLVTVTGQESVEDTTKLVLKAIGND